MFVVRIEESLGEIVTVQEKLKEDELEIQREIDSLRKELKRDQDPTRMQIIQELISVRYLFCSGQLKFNVSVQCRNYYPKCIAYEKKRLSRKLSSVISQRIFKLSTWRRRIWF